MGVLDKVKSKIQVTASDHYHNIQHVPFLADSMNPSTVNPPPPSRPLEQSLIRYRKQRGVNLGSWFVLERWITPGLFDNAAAPGQTDLDIAKGRDGKRVLEQHWDTWITDADWKYIKDRGFNSVRLPIGFYHLAAPLPKCLDGTSHSQYRDAFSGAWQRIEKAIETAGKYNLGVLVDLHAAAGGQNRDAHSGSYGSLGLWGNRVNLASTVLALQFLTSRLAPISHVVGLELLNEPATDSNVQPFYESTLPQLRKLAGPDFPLIVHDEWNLPHYTDWLSRRGDEFTVVDHHLYRAFADADKKKSGDQHAADLRGAWGASFAQWSQQAHGQLIVDEWSACLAWETLSGLSTADADRQRRNFTAAELDLFEQNTAGWYWWTLKTSGYGTDWDVANATSAQVLPQRFMRAWKGPPPSGAKEREQQAATNGHVNYWNANNGTPHADIYGAGFSRGWDDALLFLDAQGGRQQLGYIYQWQLRRRQQYERSRGSSLGGNAWEYEHGFRQGVTVCENTCLQ